MREPAYLREVGNRLEEAEITPDEVFGAVALLSELRNRIALLGVTATASTDIRPMPLAGAYPMVGTVATAVQNLLDRRFLRAAPGWMDLAAILALGLLVGALGVTQRGSRYAALVLLTLTLYAAGAYWTFVYGRLWVDLFHPLASGMVAYVGSALVAYVGEQREKAAIKSVFSRIVNKEVMEELIADPEALALGGASREVTILFTDIKGFTSLSEAMPPAGVVQLLNEYFTEMVEIVFKHGGMLDKYIGDAMMLVFGAPRPYGSRDEAPRRAVRCAVEMQKKMRQLQEHYRERSLPMLRMRIGVNTGEVVAGNIGSIKRLEYSVIGDAVNLASRLESNAPVDGVLISQYTYQHVADEVIAHKKPPLVVKGRQQPVDVYEILDVKEPSYAAESTHS
ncbi:CHASE2 domain-containing protein [bacterium]|nr:CHASE2 domain-containing protein [bacterium]